MLKRPLPSDYKDINGSPDIAKGKQIKSFDQPEKFESLNIQERIEQDFKVIKNFIHSEVQDNSKADTIFQDIIHEIAKVKRIEPGSKAKIYWRDMYYHLQDIFEVDSSNYEWHDAMADIAMLLDGTSALYSSTREANYYAEEVYNMLLGYQGQQE